MSKKIVKPKRNAEAKSGAAVRVQPLVSLLRFMDIENRQHCAPIFVLEIKPERDGWHVRLTDDAEDYESSDAELHRAVRGVMNLCCCAWWEIAKAEKDPDVRRNLKETYRRLAKAALAG